MRIDEELELHDVDHSDFGVSGESSEQLKWWIKTNQTSIYGKLGPNFRLLSMIAFFSGLTTLT